MVKICDYPFSQTQDYQPYFDAFPYPLSDFQKHAIQGTVEGNNILITAHTGSGKTLPALFAIDYFCKKGKKVIYTSPIKALSNQKFWEFSQRFPTLSFGLLTGDIKTNPTADVLIMTTEILMNYLYRYKNKQNVVNKQETVINKQDTVLDFDINIETELGCVVFDEVHYINDVSRGHVWEQTILMLPPHIQMIMLSATIDAPIKFGEWVELQGKPVWLCSTEKRVVPLTHYSFLTTHEGMVKLIKDDGLKQEIRQNTNQLKMLKSEHGIFQETNYYELKKMLDLFQKRQQFIKRKFALNSLMTFLKERQMLPAILFVFSRKQVEIIAEEICVNLLEDDSKIPYTVGKECEKLLRDKFTNFKEYLELPEYNTLVKLLEKGIGIHHSGMIPVLKEMVELFISKNYIKVLIATESFAIGLDCPIKTAVFVSLTKFDGNHMRLLKPHEYNQMSGRAGRRGIDTIGHVVHCNNLFPLPCLLEYKELLCGKPQKLESKFRISYSVVFSHMQNEERKTTTSVLYNFVKQSMMYVEIQTYIKSIQNNIVKYEEAIKQKIIQLGLKMTPVDIMEKYAKTKRDMEMASNKKKKELQRTMTSFSVEYKSLEKDMPTWYEKEEAVNILEQERNHLQESENFIGSQINNICIVLKKYGYIDGENELSLTPLGTIASNFAEVNSLVFSKFLEDVKQLSPKEIVGYISCFLKDVKDDENTESSLSCCRCEPLKHLLQKTGDFYGELQKEEFELGIVRDDEDDGLHFQMVNLVMDWCDCSNEEECKYFVQQKLGNISLGDFTKSILKIATIVGELEKSCLNDVAFLHQCSAIRPLILKYVTTSQSIYV